MVFLTKKKFLVMLMLPILVFGLTLYLLGGLHLSAISPSRSMVRIVELEEISDNPMILCGTWTIKYPYPTLVGFYHNTGWQNTKLILYPDGTSVMAYPTLFMTNTRSPDNENHILINKKVVGRWKFISQGTSFPNGVRKEFASLALEESDIDGWMVIWDTGRKGLRQYRLRWATDCSDVVCRCGVVWEKLSNDILCPE